MRVEAVLCLQLPFLCLHFARFVASSTEGLAVMMIRSRLKTHKPTHSRFPQRHRKFTSQNKFRHPNVTVLLKKIGRNFVR